MASSVALAPSKLLTTISTSRRQSQILDRWAARQAREMITTIDRQIHDAELWALSTTTQPVSARAASFLRESSSVSSAAAADDILPATVRASSLIQMWRELEADVVLSSPPSAGIEISEGRKVGDIVRILSSKEIIAGKAPADVDMTSPDAGRKVWRVRGTRGMEIFVLKLVAERRREVAGIADRRPVSRFPFRGRIQSQIRLRSFRKEVATIKHQQWSQKLEAERFETRSNNFFLRKRHENKIQLDINEVPNEESMAIMEVQPSDSDVSVCASPIDLSDSKNNHFSGLVSTREIENSPQAFFTPLSRYEDLREMQSSDASWDERSLWEWQRPSDSQEQHLGSAECNWLSQPSNSCRGWGVVRRSFYNDLLNTNFTKNGEFRELLEMKAVSTSLASEFPAKMNQMIASSLHKREQQHADVIAREECEGGIWKPNYGSSSDQEGAETSLPQLSSAMLHDQESWQDISLPLPSQILQNQRRWQSISLPLPSQMLKKQKSWQSSSSTQNSSPSVLEGEDMHDLNYSVARIHHEISELRKLVESCLDWQKKLDLSIKQEVFSALNQFGERRNLLHNSKRIQRRKDTCCICREAQVDTLLYRCGHMCACYKCAQELQWKSGRCPICRSIIADIVRAYRNS